MFKIVRRNNIFTVTYINSTKAFVVAKLHLLVMVVMVTMLPQLPVEPGVGEIFIIIQPDIAVVGEAAEVISEL